MDEVGRPGGAQPGMNGAGRTGAAASDAGASDAGTNGGNTADEFGGFGGYRRRSDGFRPTDRAEAAATIMPAWRAGVERAGVERIGAGGSYADAAAHTGLLASLRVADTNGERNGLRYASTEPAVNGTAHAPHPALTEDTLQSLRSPAQHVSMSPPRDAPDDEYVGRHVPSDPESMPWRTNSDAMPISPAPAMPMPASLGLASMPMPASSGLASMPMSASSILASMPSSPAPAMPEMQMPATATPSGPAAMPSVAMSPAVESVPMQVASLSGGLDAGDRRFDTNGPADHPKSPVAAEVDPLDMSVPVESVAAMLPHRVPAPPDVPEVTLDDDELYDDSIDATPLAGLDGPELTRIASRLRHKPDSPAELPDELDVTAVLAAVRLVPGVSDAQLRANPGGVHTLRLDLADGADPGRVSRQVARLLKERMGLAAEPRRARSEMPTPVPNDASVMPVAGTVPAPRLAPMSGIPAPRTSAEVTSGVVHPPFLTRPTSLADLSAGTPPAPDRDGIRASTGTLSGYPARVVLDQVRVATLGTEATVEVRLIAGGRPSVGTATGPAVDGYLLRLAAQAAGGAIDGLMSTDVDSAPVRCFIDHAGVVPFGSCVVAVVAVLVCGDGWVEQLVGAALVTGDPRQAIVRATLSAVNRRLESLLSSAPHR